MYETQVSYTSNVVVVIILNNIFLIGSPNYVFVCMYVHLGQQQYTSSGESAAQQNLWLLML